MIANVIQRYIRPQVQLESSRTVGSPARGKEESDFELGWSLVVNGREAHREGAASHMKTVFVASIFHLTLPRPRCP